MNAEGKKVAIVVTRWNEFITDKLKEGAVEALELHGTKSKDISIYRIPGAFEIPLICKKIAEKGDVDAIVVVGCIIRGSTPHFDYVAGEASKGISSVSLHFGLPIGFGLLTTDTIEQAIERAGTKAGNKGFEAAVTAIEMINIINKI